MGRPVKAFLTALMVLAGLILLAACANLGSLFAARASDRSREVALAARVRFEPAKNPAPALYRGAADLDRRRRARTPRQPGVVALACAHGSRCRAILCMCPCFSTRRSILWRLLLAVVSGFFFGIVPVRQVLRTDPYQIVKGAQDSGRASGSPCATFCWSCRLRSAPCWLPRRWWRCADWCVRCTPISVSIRRTQCW